MENNIKLEPTTEGTEKEGKIIYSLDDKDYFLIDAIKELANEIKRLRLAYNGR